MLDASPPEILEPACEWTDRDVADPATWTERLSQADIAELEAAVEHAAAKSADFLDIGKAQFPLPNLATRLKAIERELIDGRGMMLIRGLPRERWTNDQMSLAYWGIGAHLGRPWPQNVKGHLLGDVTDQGKTADDPTARGNEIGEAGLDYHCDGSDLVGLMCLRTGVSGGLSAIANSVALHNRMVRERPDLAAELYKPQPFDLRGEQAPGTPGWYELPVFTRHAGRLFVKFIPKYIWSSQKLPDAPRLTDKAREAVTMLLDLANAGEHSVMMEIEPGDIQFINNYHVLHGRTPYKDDREAGIVRHLKRLWLETEVLEDRPVHLINKRGHWLQTKTVSRLDAVS